jgi:biopolymer transport protein ExbB
MNLIDMFFKGGLLMWPILVCSVIAVAVVIERFFALRRAQLDVGQFMMKLKSIFHQGDLSAVEAFCAQKDAPIARIIRRGLQKHDQGPEKLREAVENAGREEVYHLEKHLSILASVAGIAPMLGFLGTVTGMIAAFQRIETLGGTVNPSDLAGGIWEALLTTAYGLFVGIPALAAYNWLVTRVRRLVHEMEVTTTEMVDLLHRRQVRHHPGDGTRSEAPVPVLAAEEDAFFRRKA